MKIVLTIVSLLAGMVLWGQRAAFSTPKISFELVAKSETKFGAIRPYSETVYTYYELRPDGKKRERWRLTLPDKYSRHWISPSGIVWVQTEAMAGPGGSGHLWARDAYADLKGTWYPPGRDRTTNVQAVSLPSGAEQLRMTDKDGSEYRFTIIPTVDREVTLSRKLDVGEVDHLTKALEKPQNPTDIAFTPIAETPFGVWKLSPNGSPVYIRQTRSQSQIPLADVSDEMIGQAPARVTKTPSGKFLWFTFKEFGEPSEATMEVLQYDGTTVATVDLLKLGGFQNGDQAKRAILYGDVLWSNGGLEIPVDSNRYLTPTGVETIKFGDRSGRKFLIKLTQDGEAYQLDARASFNLDSRPEVAQTTFPTAKLVSTQEASSQDGKFRATAKTYEEKGKAITQVTLVGYVDDPVEGIKTVQLFDMPAPAKIEGLRVSNSGRVFAVSFAKDQPVGDEKMDFCLFHAWEPSGRNMSLDLLRSKWFLNLDHARSELSMTRFEAKPEGVRGERMVDGVPIPVYPLEELTFTLASGKKENLYIGNVNEHLPSLFYYRRPSKVPGIK